MLERASAFRHTYEYIACPVTVITVCYCIYFDNFWYSRMLRLSLLELSVLHDLRISPHRNIM